MDPRRTVALCVVGLAVAVFTSACASSERLEFGPVYPVDKVSDPLVAETIKQDAIGEVKQASGTANSPATGAEIRGYLIDWVTGNALLEYAVLKDGSVHSIPDVRGSGARPSVRLEPEPAAEAVARESAVVSARFTVEWLKPEFANIEPFVYSYIVRIHRKDGSSSDVWVQPDVSPTKMDYRVRLGPSIRQQLTEQAHPAEGER